MRENMLKGFMVEIKLRGKWTNASQWKESIMGWTPAIFPTKAIAMRFKAKLAKKGVYTILASGEFGYKKVPVRICQVEYEVEAGATGFRLKTFDIKSKHPC